MVELHFILYISLYLTDFWLDLCYPVAKKYLLADRIWWLYLVPTSTTRFASDLGYRMAKNSIGLYKENTFYEHDIKFLNIEWRVWYSLTNFEERFWIARLHYFLDPNMCSFWYICMFVWS